MIEQIMTKRKIGKITMPVVEELATMAEWDTAYKACRKEWEKLSPFPFKNGYIIAQKGNYKKTFYNTRAAAEFFAGIIEG